MTEWSPPIPHDDAMPKDGLRRLVTLAKSPESRVIWRHKTCRKIVLVVTDNEDGRWLHTFFHSRPMTSGHGQAMWINGMSLGAVGATDEPARCCGEPFTVSWADAWADADKAKSGDTPVTRELDFH